MSLSSHRIKSFPLTSCPRLSGRIVTNEIIFLRREARKSQKISPDTFGGGKSCRPLCGHFVIIQFYWCPPKLGAEVSVFTAISPICAREGTGRHYTHHVVCFHCYLAARGHPVYFTSPSIISIICRPRSHHLTCVTISAPSSPSVDPPRQKTYPRVENFLCGRSGR